MCYLARLCAVLREVHQFIQAEEPLQIHKSQKIRQEELNIQG